MLKAIFKMLKREHLGRLSQSEFLPARRHKIVFVCVLVCVCGGMCVLMCVCLCACRYMWECEGQRSMSAVFLNWTPLCFLMAGLFAGPGLLSLVILTGQWTLRIACLCSPASSPGVSSSQIISCATFPLPFLRKLWWFEAETQKTQSRNYWLKSRMRASCLRTSGLPTVRTV